MTSRLDVLFIGNSFTARNDVPGLVARLAAARGTTVRVRLVSAGGASLRRHWNAGEAQREIEADPPDVVVLQEQSTLPAKNPSRMYENVRLFDAATRAAGARTLLYMTWARQAEPESQIRIAEAYTTIAAELGTAVAPAGLAWQRFLAEHDAPPLHDRDGSHPTLAGSYLAACVLVRTLTGESPAGLDVPIAGLSAEDAALLRTFA